MKIQEWQISEIKKGIAEADAGEFVEHSSILQHWEKKQILHPSTNVRSPLHKKKPHT